MDIERDVITLLGYPNGTRLGVWPEVKLKAADSIAESTKRFDYTFDYVVMPLGDLSRESEPGLPWDSRLSDWGLLGYEPASDGESLSSAPVGQPTIIEIMTSSTSGGNKRRNTTIPQAFRDSIIMERPAIGPGINYRQVWARMVSQLIVKSEVAIAWGGNALWVIQDVLAEYISDTTALDMAHHRANGLSEVNVLSLSYGDLGTATSGVIELPDRQLFAGPIAGSDESDGFLDIIRAGVKPDRAVLVNALLSRRPSAEIVVG